MISTSDGHMVALSHLMAAVNVKEKRYPHSQHASPVLSERALSSEGMSAEDTGNGRDKTEH
jgi:hypothetical protein